MKFKVGDKVKFIGDTTKHFCFGKDLKADIKKYNNVFTIDYISEDYVEFKENRCWCIKEYEIELIQEKQFTKADLKNGDIVTYKNGDKRTVAAGNLINSGGYISKKLSQYTNDLKDTVIGKNLDIIKVERPVQYDTVFERKEEILDETEKKYLANVIRPFKNEVRYIVKYDNPLYSGKEYLRIKLKGDEEINFPDFKKDYMYKGMKENKKYTLKELGL